MDDLLELAEAAELLGVHQSTLRRWADNGKVPHVRTLSGRRRFARKSIINAREEMNRSTPKVEPAELELNALSQARQRTRNLSSEKVGWMAGLNDDQRLLLRYSGQHLLGLMLQYIHCDNNGEEYLEEGRRMAGDYSRVCSNAGLSITETAETFLYFRHTIIESIQNDTVLNGITSQESSRLILRAVSFFDALLIATLESYNRIKPIE